jgi:putative drug exporter of the RND superfamily
LRALAAWSFRHRRIVVVGWLLALVLMSGLSKAVGTAYSNTFDLPNTESTKAIELLQAAAPKQAGDTANIVIGTTGGTKVTDPDVQASVEAMLKKLSALPHVSTIVSPYQPAGAGQVSQDGTVAFAVVTFDTQAQFISIPAAQTFVNTARAAAGPNLTIAVSGQVAQEANPQSVGGAGFGILAAGVVLFIVFGSLLAMTLPLVSALVSLGTAIGLIGLLSHALRMPEFSSQLVLLIGLGVGVDYALFIVSRHRQGLLAGRPVEASVVAALDTSGRAVLFAGIIVCIALLGMFALGISFLYGLAVAASIGVLFTMAAALTLLPALLGFLGLKVLSRRQRKTIGERGQDGLRKEGFWVRWSATVERRPIAWGLISLVLVAALAVPFLSLRLGSSDEGNDPTGSTTRTAYDLLAKGFGPGFNGPFQITSQLNGPADEAALQRVADAVGGTPGIVGVTKPVVIPAANGTKVAVFGAYPSTAPQDAATTQLIDRLREQTIPAAVKGSTLTVYVGGITAIFTDFARVLTSKLPLFIGVVVLLSFLLLMVVFRSLLVPLVAAAMNLLSVAAAFGILTAVFQWGWLGSVIGVTRTGPVESFLPVMLFAILFGLSMDYEVFLVMRIHEEWLRSGDNREAVRTGLAATGRTITAAAVIMVLVFGSFVLGGQRIIKEFGLGLSAAILVDAVVIRSALVPSIMFLIGKANWWFPSWLDRILPRINVEPQDLGEIEPVLVSGQESGDQMASKAP